MKVEFVPQEYDDCMAVSAAEFLKADKNRDEYASLAMATDAFSALYGIQYIIPREDYDVVKEWLTKSSTVVFYKRQARYGPKKWCEICVIDGPRTQRVRYSVDEYGREIVIDTCPYKAEKTKTSSTAGRRTVKKRNTENE